MATAGKKKPQRTGFVAGAIVRVKLEDFVTYDSVEFYPEPHLNVIIGPNGTGKSTIVCAICLGLAGKPALLGRAPQPAEFIKHGADRAMVEIELHNPNGQNYNIRREIYKKNNTSQWSVNDRAANQKSIEELVTRHNIQIGNLCQFLPQDKVADFAKMTPQELLENTEKAVGTNNLFENHNKLKNARQRARDLELQYKNSSEYLEKEIQKNARLEQDVLNYEEKQRHLEKIKILQMKRPWTVYEEKRAEYKQQIEVKKKMADEIRHQRSLNAPLRNKCDTAKENATKVEQLMREKTEQVKKHAHDAASKSKAIENQTDKMVEVQDELKLKRAEEAKRKKKVSDLEKQLGSLQVEMESLGETEDVQPAIDHVNRETRRINTEMARQHQQLDVVKQESQMVKREISAFQGELQQLQNINNRRLEILRSRHKHSYDAVMWLRSNKHLFSGVVHEPIMLILNMKNVAFAKYVESHINPNDMRAFVFENPEDMELFSKKVRDQQGLKVNAAKMPEEPLSYFQPDKPISHYRRYGFHSYLKDLFDCPEAVMRYLCLLYKVHKIPVGNNDTKNKVESIIMEHKELRSFYTQDHRYTIKNSRYGGGSSSRSSQLGRPRVLTVTVDMARVQQIQNQLQEKQNVLQVNDIQAQELQKSLRDSEVKMNSLRNEKKELTQKRDSRKQLASSIQLKQASIKRLEDERVNIEGEENKALQKIKQINIKKCKLLEELKDLTQMCMDLSMGKVRLSLKHSSAMRHVVALDKQLREQSGSLQNLEREFEDLKNRTKQMKEAAMVLLKEARAATNTKEDESLPENIRMAFEVCPSTLLEIDAAIHAEQARADCTFNIDESIVREFNQRKKEIARIKQDVQAHNGRLENHSTEIKQLESNWLEPLLELISKINVNFSNFFKQMKCAGEVDLSVPDNHEDYEKYGIRIKVKYRDAEQLQELTPFHQSGGERSVATVLYMMALQELTRCPFRCVDEINQGMDPINERKVFELVVKTACRENTSQYFLLTPKLLPDLEYTEAMTVLCINNGPQMLNHTQWDVNRFLRRRHRLAE